MVRKIDKIMSKAYRLKEDVYGDNPTYITPTEVKPIMWAWALALIITIITLFTLDWNGKIAIIIVWFLLNYGFFNSKVLL